MKKIILIMMVLLLVSFTYFFVGKTLSENSYIRIEFEDQNGIIFEYKPNTIKKHRSEDTLKQKVLDAFYSDLAVMNIKIHKCEILNVYGAETREILVKINCEKNTPDSWQKQHRVGE